MAAKCPFYQLHTDQLASKAADRIPWCSHMQSPVTFVIATATSGPAKKLTCGGDIRKCQIPPELRPPLWLASD